MRAFIFCILFTAFIMEIPGVIEVYRRPQPLCAASALPAFPGAWIMCKAMGQR